MTLSRFPIYIPLQGWQVRRLRARRDVRTFFMFSRMDHAKDTKQHGHLSSYVNVTHWRVLFFTVLVLQQAMWMRALEKFAAMQQMQRRQLSLRERNFCWRKLNYTTLRSFFTMMQLRLVMGRVAARKLSRRMTVIRTDKGPQEF